MSDDIKTTVTKVKRLIETKVILEPTWIPLYRRKTEEDKATYLDQWCRAFNIVIGDRLHQDLKRVYVDRTYEVQCTGCGHEWEEMDFDGVTCCAWCGVPIEIVK